MTDLLTFSAPIELTAAAEGKRPTFSIVAYTGGPLNVAGFYNPVVIDLAGLKAARQDLPILKDHDTAQIVGQADAVRIDRNGVVITGKVTGENAAAVEVVSQARNGFQWQASVGASIERREVIEPGKTAIVNGKTLTGPLPVARQSTLFETSFVAIGADGNTSASIAARKASMNTTATDTQTATDTSAAPDTIQAERERAGRIMQTVTEWAGKRPNRVGEIQALAARALSGELTEAEFNLESLRTFRSSTCGPVPPEYIQHVRAGTGAVNDAQIIAASLLVRAGLEGIAVKSYGEQATEAARRYGPRSMLDVCKAALAMEHRDCMGMGKNEIVKAAMSTLSLPTTLSNVTGRALVEAYMEGTQSWRGFARVQPAADFKTQTSIRPSFVGQLEKLGKGGEVKHGSMAESTYTWNVDTYAKMFSVSRTDLINDDLGFLGQAPVLMGRAGARAVNDLVYSTILANAGSWFATGNNNYATGNALSITTFGTAVAAMRSQRDAQGNDIQIVPRILQVPPELEATARQIVNSTTVGRTDGGPTQNPWEALVDVSVESRLSNSTKFTSTSATAWYLWAGPMDSPIIVGFLDGVETPTVEAFPWNSQAECFDMSFRCFLDFGCSLGDPKAAQKRAGA